MRLIHQLRITIFVKPEDIQQDADIESKIKSRLAYLCGIELEKEKIGIKLTKNQGFNEREIRIYELTLLKEAHTNIFLKNFAGLLNSAQKSLILDQKESRLDEALDFFIRLHKNSMLDGQIILTDSGDCFHLRLNIAAFPKKREVALDIIEKIFR